jgi:hypothetical protein
MTDFLDGVRMGSFDTEYDDDTIEMVLTESAMHLLAHAAAQTESSSAIVSPVVKEPEAEPGVQASLGARALGVAEAPGTAKAQPVAEVQDTGQVRPVAEAPGTAKVSPVPEAPGAAQVPPVAEAQAATKVQADADSIVKAQPIGGRQAASKGQAVVKAQPTTEAPAAVARQQPIAKDQVPPGYRPPMSTLRFALILSLVAVGSALLTAGTYFLTTRAPPPVKVVTIRVPAAPAPAVAVTPPPPAATALPSLLSATAPPSPLPATAAMAAPPAPSTDQPATVRFVNPFDKKEVFEFPPGTSQADARDAVADLLAERARDRRGQLVKMPPRNGKTAADSGAPVVASGVAPRS